MPPVPAVFDQVGRFLTSRRSLGRRPVARLLVKVRLRRRLTGQKGLLVKRPREMRDWYWALKHGACRARLDRSALLVKGLSGQKALLVKGLTGQNALLVKRPYWS